MTDIVERLRDWSNQQGTDFWAQDDAAVLWEAADEIERLRAALQDMLHAVCGETGFAAAVRAHSGIAYPWEPLDIAEEKARAILGKSSHE